MLRHGQSRLQIGVESEHVKNATDWNRRDCARGDGQKSARENLAETGFDPDHEDGRPFLAAHETDHGDQDPFGGSCHEEIRLAGEPDRQYCLDVHENWRGDPRCVGLGHGTNDAHLTQEPYRDHQKVVFQFEKCHAAHVHNDIGCQNYIAL